MGTMSVHCERDRNRAFFSKVLVIGSGHDQNQIMLGESKRKPYHRHKNQIEVHGSEHWREKHRLLSKFGVHNTATTLYIANDVEIKQF